MAFNPFLSEVDYATAPIEHPFMGATGTTEQSNPFLTGFAEVPQATAAAEANPFLSYDASAYDYSQPAVTSVPMMVTATNPFADFAAAAPMTTADMYGGTGMTNGPYGVGHVSMEWASATTVVPDYSMTAMTMPSHAMTMGMFQPEVPGTVPEQSSQYMPRSTQDLLNSVTGALEATSDTLLDRLKVIPSPAPDQPSPSPRSPSPDLMFGDDPPPPPPPSANPMNPSPLPTENIIDLFDAPTGPKTSVEILGLYASMVSQPTPVQTAPVVTASVAPPIVETTTSLVDMSEPAPPPVVEVQDPEPEPTPVEDAKVIPVTVPEPEPEQVVPTVTQPEPILSPPEPMKLDDVPKPKSAPPERPKPPPVPVAPAVPRVPSPVPAPVSAPPPPAVIPQPVPHPTAHPQMPAPPPVPPARSPVTESKAFPSRPPPPVPPAPRMSHPTPPPPVPVAPAVPPQPKSQPEPPAPPQPPVQTYSAPAPAPAPAAEKISPFVATTTTNTFSTTKSAFDDFDAKFASLGDGVTTATDTGDAFGTTITVSSTDDTWGGSGASSGFEDSGPSGFGNDSGFDAFLALTEPPPVPQSTPAKTPRPGQGHGGDDQDEHDLSIVIKQRNDGDTNFGLAPALAPPPKSPAISTGSAFSEDSGPAFVPFLSSARDTTYDEAARTTQLTRTDSQETPQTPLFEEDTSQPLEDFPRIKYTGDGWDMQMRHPNKKKITGQRFWKKVFVRLVHQNDTPIVQIYGNKGDKEPFQEIPLQPCYSVSDIGAQQFDQYGKIFTVKLQYIFYKERPGVRPGQISKAERITTKLTQFAAFAIQGDYAGVKEFGSDLKKLGMPIEHAPQPSQLAKLGTQNFEELKQFSCAIEEALFHMTVHRDRAIQYKTEEVQVTIVDEYFTEQDIYGVVTRQIARVRVFFLSFLSGMAEVEMGINDLRRQGKEVVGRHDIITIPTEEWIRIEFPEFSNCIQMDEFDNTKVLKFKPPDACYIELMRFRVRPPRRRELPIQVKTMFVTTGQRIEIKCDLLVPGFTSRKLGQIPCEDVAIRIPIPETWIYMFRVEKHFRYGSVKSAHRRSGKVKGIERFLGAVEAVDSSLMEVTSGQAKYEHQHRAIVWRISRLPKEGQGAYTSHSFVCRVTLQAHEEIPDNLARQCFVEFTMPHTTVSHTVCRSISVPNCDEPPEKCVRYLSRHEYIVDIEHTQGFAPASYNLAAAVKKEEPPPPEPTPEPPMEGKAQSDSDFSDD